MVKKKLRCFFICVCSRARQPWSLAFRPDEDASSIEGHEEKSFPFHSAGWAKAIQLSWVLKWIGPCLVIGPVRNKIPPSHFSKHESNDLRATLDLGRKSVHRWFLLLEMVESLGLSEEEYLRGGLMSPHVIDTHGAEQLIGSKGIMLHACIEPRVIVNVQ